MKNDQFQLNDGNFIPKIGLGLYDIPEGAMTETIRYAYETGYRLYDTASYYKNEDIFGSAVKELGINRADILIASKVWPSEMGYSGVKEALKRSLKRLQTDYVDFYYIHWPIKDPAKLRESWRAMEELKDEGLIRSVAVSNFKPHHLMTIMEGHKYLPTVNQIERHPLLTQKDVIDFGKIFGIVTEAWSPLMRGKTFMDFEVIKKLADKYGKTPAQIILNWNMLEGVVSIPKSATPSRIYENYQIFDFELSPEDIKAIDVLNKNKRLDADPDDYFYCK